MPGSFPSCSSIIWPEISSEALLRFLRVETSLIVAERKELRKSRGKTGGGPELEGSFPLTDLLRLRVIDSVEVDSCLNSCGSGCRGRFPVGLVLDEATAARAAFVASLTEASELGFMPIDVLLLLGDNGEGRCTAEMEFRSLLGESGAESNRCRTRAGGGGVTLRSMKSSPWLLSRSVSEPEGGVSFTTIVEVPCETTRGRDPPDSLVDVDDTVDDDDGIGDRADRPSAGEGELNRIPLNFSSASWFLFAKFFTLSNAETVSFEDAEAVETVDFLLLTPNFAV